MIFDVSAQKWTRPCDCRADHPMWSHDGKYLYFQDYLGPDKLYGIARLRLSDRKIENVAELSSVGRFTAVETFGQWFGLTPDDSPLLARDASTQEIYALGKEWP